MRVPRMRIAHISDLHLLDWTGVSPLQFLNARFTGWLNMRFRRKSIHRATYVQAIAERLHEDNVDHVIITGDITNLALESEFAFAKRVLEDSLRMSPRDVTIVPGNHDAYTFGSYTKGRFGRTFREYLESDLPDLTVATPLGRFPVVKLRGNAAVIGLSSAVPRFPFVAAGELGRAQLTALAEVLVHPEVMQRTPIIALHHPLDRPQSPLKAWLEGLRDAEPIEKLLRGAKKALVVHGHLHRRLDRPTADGIRMVGATSASLHHHDQGRMAAFNMYELKEGRFHAWSEVYEATSNTFVPMAVPTTGWE